MKTTTTFLEKMEVINDIMDLARDESGLSITTFELAKVFYITNLYVGDKYNIKDEEGINSIIKTYENIVQSGFWFELIDGNRDIRYLIELAGKKYEEELKIFLAENNALIKQIRDMVTKTPSSEKITDLISEAKELVDKTSKIDV